MMCKCLTALIYSVLNTETGPPKGLCVFCSVPIRLTERQRRRERRRQTNVQAKGQSHVSGPKFKQRQYLFAVKSLGHGTMHLQPHVFELQVTAGSTISMISCVHMSSANPPPTPYTHNTTHRHTQINLKFPSKWFFSRTHILHPSDSLQHSDLSQ